MPRFLSAAPTSFRSLALACLSAAALSACGIYMPNVAQGNYVTKAQVDQLQLGMTREQVRFVMGSPLLVDPFRPERWEYVFWFQNNRENTRAVRAVTVLFEADKVSKVQATSLPASDDGSDPALPKINPATLTK